MFVDSLSAVVKCNGMKYVGVATLHDEVLVDVAFYGEYPWVDELIFLASVRDKKIPFSQKGVNSYVKKIVEYHADSFYVACRNYANDKERKENLSTVIESVSVTNNFSATPDVSKTSNELEITIQFTEKFSNKAFAQIFKDGEIIGRIDESTLYLGCIVD